ncbi:MAG: CRISPR-associated ring nuclease [Caldimonas manganoxidans]|nr:CRISPR-associated ring nuclease [Caldimonas manganoxidans]
MPVTILVASLGASWEVVPEILGWLAPQWVDVYAHHPQREALQEQRERWGLEAPQQVWILTTQGQSANDSVGRLCEWWDALIEQLPLQARPELRLWCAAQTDALASTEECRRWREMALRAVLAAHAQACGGKVVLSLAGGRKTMSADLQDAAHAFGAAALLHVVADEQMLRTPGLLDKSPRAWLQPLPAQAAAAISPMVISRAPGEPALRVVIDGQDLRPQDYPLHATPQRHSVWQPDGRWLDQEIERRRRQAQHLLVGQALVLARSDPYEPWPLLLRLEPARIDVLRRPLAQSTDDFLAAPERWPLADLHRHLGGCLSVEQQRDVAAEVLQATPAKHRADAQRALDRCWTGWRGGAGAAATPDWPQRLRCAATQLSEQAGLPEPCARAVAAALVLQARSCEDLAQLLWADTEPRVALKSRHPWKFAAYERPGELSGSALLGHPAALVPYARAVVRQALEEGLLYVEWRASPHKYWPDDPVGWVRAFERALREAGAGTNTYDERMALRAGLIWIVDRRQRDKAAQVVRWAVEAHEQRPEFLLGLDLAGDEGTTEPQALAQHFEPAFQACLRITIHAGEGESAERIWQAAYHLHADRIGHGLTLIDDPRLAQRFRDRGIALELCPSSNQEVVGYADPQRPETADLPEYPLQRLLEAGLPLTLNTDNPAISRTSLAQEYRLAARVAPGMSVWTALSLLKMAYQSAFVPARERTALQRKAAQKLMELATHSARHPS